MVKVFIKNMGSTIVVETEEEQIGFTTNYDEIEEIVDDFLDENDIDEIVDIVEL